MGDCVLSTPALSILHQHRPDLQIAVVVEERFAPVFEGNPDLARILPPSVSAVSRWQPELVLNLHGGTRSLLLTAACRARLRAGFGHFRAPWIYNIRIPRAQQILEQERTVHTAEHLASAMFYLGAPVQPIGRARLFATGDSPVAPPYAVLHPFASAPEKTWPAASFVEVARSLHTQGIQPVIAGSPQDDFSAFSGWTTVASDLRNLKNVLARAELFIGNDSGPAHMAAAFGLPVVVLFGPSNPGVWAPWRVESQVLVSDGPLASIPPERVLRALEQLRVAR